MFNGTRNVSYALPVKVVLPQKNKVGKLRFVDIEQNLVLCV